LGNFPQKSPNLAKILMVIRAAVGALGVIVFFFWLLLVYEKPSVHPWISREECKMIESKQGEAAIIYEVCRSLSFLCRIIGFF